MNDEGRNSVELFFRPQGVAVVGASHNPTKLGFVLARNLVKSGYRGAIHFVNVKGGRLLERPVYQSLLDVPDPVDLAVLFVPAAAMVGELEKCGRRGIRAAIVMASGFRETGAEGAALEAECLRVAREQGIRLMGPNCVGILDTHVPLDTTFMPPPGPTPGDVAFVSHSGAICAAVIDWARGQGFGLSRLISLGNQVDVAEAEGLTMAAADPHTRVVTMYLEGVKDGRGFVEVAQEVARQKPVLALKVGRFASGQRAAASHTGALAGQDVAFDAAFRRAGVIRVGTSEELFDWARALAWCPLPKGRGMAVLTNAGGPGVAAADALESHGLYLAELGAETQAALRQILPPQASVRNPVDTLADVTPERFASALRLLLADANVHGVLVIQPPPPIQATGAVIVALMPVIYTADKPVVVALMGERMIQEAVEHLRAARIPDYRFPERAAGALAILAQRAEFLAQGRESPVRVADARPAEVEAVLASQAAGSFLPQEATQRILAAYGIPTPAVKLAKTEAEAVAWAEEMGYPVALKVASPDITHKSEVGGVRLNLSNGAAVAAGFAEMVAEVQRARPAARLTGVYVQPMAAAGQEVIVGALQDPHFSSLVMFGSGGVEVEGLKDVEFGLAPLTMSEAEGMLARTWAGRKLAGYRGAPAADRAAVLDVLLRVGQLAADFPQLVEMEINPLRVMAAGQGVWAVDARIRLAGDTDGRD